MNKRGFTLTEVLIALSIIGFIAAMTMPNLMVSTGNKKLKTTIQKFLADMNQAVKLYEMDHGVILQSNANNQANAFATVMITKSRGFTNHPIYYSQTGTWTGTYPLLNLQDNSSVIFLNNREVIHDIDGHGKGQDRTGFDMIRYYMYQIGGAWTLMPYHYDEVAHAYHWTKRTDMKCGQWYGWNCAQQVLDTY